jgi:hypothetical protein
LSDTLRLHFETFSDEARPRITFRNKRFENVLQLVPEDEAVTNKDKTLRFHCRRICLSRQGGLSSNAKRSQRREQQVGKCEKVFRGLFDSIERATAFIESERCWMKR